MIMYIIATLILVGLLLLIAELLLIPGVGIAGILGLCSMGASCWYAYHFFDHVTGTVVVVINVILLIIFTVFALREKTWKRFELGTEIASKVNAENEKIKVGDQGMTETRLAPMGTARFENTSCEVKSEDNSLIASGTPVIVTRIEDNKVIVKPITV